MTVPQISILMPCLNEAETLEKCIRKAQAFLERSGRPGEIVVADNGSTDGSQAIAAKLGARVVDIPLRGYGAALIGGIAAAEGEYIVMGDSDDSYDFSALDAFIEKLDSGYDLVMGNRFKGGIKPGAMPFLHRYLGNPVLSWIGRLFFGGAIRDFHCGLRAFRRDAIMALNLRTIGMEFASEMVVKSILHGLKVTEVPTILYPDGRSRPPHLRTWSDGWRHLRFLTLYSPRWLFLYPGLLLIVIGLAVSLWLLPGPRLIGHIELDINTLTYAAFMILAGFQAVIFAIFSKVFAITGGLLPQDAQMDGLLKQVTLERGLILSMVLIVIGLGSSVAAMFYWSSRQFGPLDPSISMRFVIPGIILFALGLQIFFSSFFLSLLLLKRK